jgi:hypothetical protein
MYLMFLGRKLKEYKNELPIKEELPIEEKTLKPLPNGNLDNSNLEGYISRIEELKAENEKLKLKIKNENWLDKQRFDLDNYEDKNTLLQILKNNINIIARGGIGNIRIYDDFYNECYLLKDSLQNKCMKIDKEKIDY